MPSNFKRFFSLIEKHINVKDQAKILLVSKTLSDGFRIAEEDLALRGPGDFMGEQQSGFYQFRVANLMRDAAILSEARHEAFRLAHDDPRLARQTYALLRQVSGILQGDGDEFIDVA